MRVPGDFGGAVVADVRTQRGHQHEGIGELFGDARAVRLDAARAIRVEARDRVGQHARARKVIVDDQRLVDIELEVSRCRADAERDIVTHDLAAHHGKGFALSRVHLARHDGATGLVFRQAQFAYPAARTGCEPTDVVDDFHQGHGEGPEVAMRARERIVRGERSEAVGRAAIWPPGFARERGGDQRAEPRMRVLAGTDSGTAHGEFVQRVKAGFDRLLGMLQLRSPARHFLSEGQWRGVLQVGTSDLDDSGEGRRFSLERRAQAAQSREQVAGHVRRGSHVHRSRKDVVGGLA